MRLIVVILSIALTLTTIPQKQASSVVGNVGNSKLTQATKIVEVQEATYTAPEPKNAPEPPKIAQNNGSCLDWIAQAGVTDIESAYWLIMKESGCRPNAKNASSGAYGIPQSLPASKIAHCGDEPICQIQWMQNYVNNRYGGWAGAVAHSKLKGWY